MHRYIPNTDAQRMEMLRAMGMKNIEDLFIDIPKAVRLKSPLNLPESLSELELCSHMQKLAGDNLGAKLRACFLGAGAYDHYVPAVIDHLILRQEFFTAYTPYQAEISQGTLQAIYEFQTMICELTGMDVANASVYDGATAVAEAAFMAQNATRRNGILVAQTVHPETRAVLTTYCGARNTPVRQIPRNGGVMDVAALGAALCKDTAAVVVQSPNFFGCVEDLAAIAALCHEAGALLIASVDPISLGLLASPGELGADIAVGDGQALGVPLCFGGPTVGFLAAKSTLLRSMPGRIIGATTDNEGNRAFVLTMQTREQHIRREKATSNICTNNALVALINTIYLTVMGKQGLREVALQCLEKAHYTRDALLSTGRFEPAFDAPFFKEFVLKAKDDVDALNRKLQSAGILGGYAVERDYPDLVNHYMVAVTEKRSKADIDEFVGRVVA